MRAIWFALVVGLGIMAMTSTGQAQDAAPAPETMQAPETAFLTEMFSDTPLTEDRFAAVLLAQVPFPQLTAVIGQLKATIGPVEQVQIKGDGKYLIVTKTHELPVQMVLDADHKIAGILFQPPIARNLSVADALKAFPAEAAYLIVKNDTVVQQQRADETLAVGSAFKLGILAVIAEDIAAGKRHWDDVLRLSAENISLPSGTLQGWPVGSPLTLHTLAAMMISISDNTATDTLLASVGREAVEQKLDFKPVFSTREFFILKGDAALRQRWIEGDEATRRAVLADVDKLPLPDPASVVAPHNKGLEYYVPLTTLCRLIGAVADLDVMQINPGVADKADWAKVAFKGGSELGVLNLTTQVTTKAGDTFCVAATWNPATGPVDEGAATGAFASLLKALAQNP